MIRPFRFAYVMILTAIAAYMFGFGAAVLVVLMSFDVTVRHSK